jgi:hypothetical protein
VRHPRVNHPRGRILPRAREIRSVATTRGASIESSRPIRGGDPLPPSGRRGHDPHEHRTNDPQRAGRPTELSSRSPWGSSHRERPLRTSIRTTKRLSATSKAAPAAARFTHMRGRSLPRVHQRVNRHRRAPRDLEERDERRVARLHPRAMTRRQRGCPRARRRRWASVRDVSGREGLRRRPGPTGSRARSERSSRRARCRRVGQSSRTRLRPIPSTCRSID